MNGLGNGSIDTWRCVDSLTQTTYHTIIFHLPAPINPFRFTQIPLLGKTSQLCCRISGVRQWNWYVDEQAPSLPPPVRVLSDWSNPSPGRLRSLQGVRGDLPELSVLLICVILSQRRLWCDSFIWALLMESLIRFRCRCSSPGDGGGERERDLMMGFGEVCVCVYVCVWERE